jgi:hypothetical protein
MALFAGRRNGCSKHFARPAQRSVNHARQHPVNHGAGKGPRYDRLTPNLKPIPTHLRHDLPQRPGE